MLPKLNHASRKIVGIVLAVLLVCSIVLVQRIFAANVSVSEDRDVTTSTQDQPHRITFNMQGGGHILDSSDKAYTVYEYELPAGAKLESPYTPVSDDANLMFAGWAQRPGGETLDREYVPQSDMTVYAVFNRKCTVCFNFNGGYLKDAEGRRLTSMTAEYPENGDFTWNYAEIPNHESGTFSCWTLDASGTQPLAAEPRVASDMTVYAQYKRFITADPPSEMNASVAAADDMEVVGASESQTFSEKATKAGSSEASGQTGGDGTIEASSENDPENISVGAAASSTDAALAGSAEQKSSPAAEPASEADLKLDGDAAAGSDFSGSVNVDQFASSASDCDLYTMCTKAVDYCEKNKVATIELTAGKNYVVYDLIYLPAGISVEGNGAKVYVAYDGYAFGMNAKSVDTWVKAYAFLPKSGISGIKFENANPSQYPNACGILMQLTGSYIRNCTFRQLSMSIRSAGQYIDNREIANVYINKGLGSVDLYLGLGDGAILSNLTEVKCKLVNVAGATITSGIQNTYTLKECKAVSISGEHDEQISGTHQFINSVVTVSDSFFYLMGKTTMEIKKNDNNHGSSVTLRNVTFEDVDGQNGNAVLANDAITVGPQCSLRLENVTETVKVKGGHTAAGTGLKINGNFIHPLYQREMDFSVSGNGNMFIKNSVEASTNHVDTTTVTVPTKQDTGKTVVGGYSAGTYHFSSKFMIDPERALVMTRAKNTDYSDQVITISDAKTRLRFRAYTETFAQTGYLRIYRGTAAHKYDKYVDVPISGLLVDDYLTCDDGEYIGLRYKWQSRVSSDVEAENACDRYVLLSNGLVEAYMKSVPVTGTWKTGDRVINTDLSANPSGWVCTEGGSPGKWKTIAGETVNQNAVTKDQFNDTVNSVTDTMTTLSGRSDVVFEVQNFKSAGATTISFKLAHRVQVVNSCHAVITGGNSSNVSITSVTVDRNGNGKLAFSGNPGSGNTLQICFMYPNGDGSS
uniref:InlB B-repeat-containing protein n=1 Tax=Eubacterium cellulosolvens TaxID=29322 RepID=UPI000480D4B4|nr:InlB B-repeat-containing protein [[Eubacterium] cellulosolvens]